MSEHEVSRPGNLTPGRVGPRNSSAAVRDGEGGLTRVVRTGSVDRWGTRRLLLEVLSFAYWVVRRLFELLILFGRTERGEGA